MRDHPGIDDQRTDVGDGYAELTNVTHYVTGEIRRCPVMSNRMAAGGVAISEYTDPVDGVHAVHVSSDGEIQTTKVGNSTSSNELETGFTVDRRPTMARAEGRVYIANDLDRMKAVDGADSIRNAGMQAIDDQIGAPTQSAGSNTTEGSHLFRYRFYDSSTGYYSSPSPSRSVTVSDVGTDGDIAFDVGSGSDIDTDFAESHADQIILQATAAGGTAYYDASFSTITDVTGGSISFDMSDATLVVQTQTGSNSAADSERPPSFAIVTEHSNRLFGIGAYARDYSVGVTNGSATVSFVTGPATSGGFGLQWAGRKIRIAGDDYTIKSVDSNTQITLTTNYSGSTGNASATIYSTRRDVLYWSSADNIEGWQPDANSRRAFVDTSDVPTALVSVGSELYIFSRRRVSTLAYDSDPATGFLSPVGDFGVWNQHCVTRVENAIYGWGPSGAWVMYGSYPKYISRAVEGAARRGNIDTSYADDFSVSFDPRSRTVNMYYVKVGDTTPRYAFSLLIDTGRWSERSYDAGITAATTMQDESGETREVVADSNGYSWFMRFGGFHGVSTARSAILTSSAGATTTVIPVNESLQTSPDLRGVYLYQPSSGESRLIASNTTSEITLDSALTAAPSTNDELYIGRVESIIETDWMPAGANFSGKYRSGRIEMSTRATGSSGTAKVRVWSDFSSNLQQYTASNDDVMPDGVTVNSDGTLTVDLDGGTSLGDGYVPAPGFADHARTWKVRLTIDRPEGEWRLLSLGMARNRDDGEEERQE